MIFDIDHKEIDKLEQELSDFEQHWRQIQQQRIIKWRQFLLASFVVIMGLLLLYPKMFILLWWLGIVLIGFTAGSLYKIINDEAKAAQQMLEHKKQLKLARLLLDFDYLDSDSRL